MRKRPRAFGVTLALLFIRGALGLLVLSGCKGTGNQSQTASEADVASGLGGKPKIFIVLNGGWGSCSDTNSPVGSRTFDSMNALVESLQPSLDVYYVIGCQDKWPPWRPFAKMSFMGRGIPFVRDVPSLDWAETVNTYIQKIQPERTYFIGHSYGGWIVLDLLRRGLRSDLTFTLDPIDAERCTPPAQILNPIGISGPGCIGKPEMNYAALVPNTGTLVNYWQDIGLIHSGAINGAENSKTDVRKHPYFRGSLANEGEYKKYTHRLIGAFAPVWEDICRRIKSDAGVNDDGCWSIETDVDGHEIFRAPVVKSLQCSYEGQGTIWVINLTDISRQGGDLSAIRENVVYAKKGGANGRMVPDLSTQGGSRLVFNGNNASLTVDFNADGRTGSGVFDIQHQQYGPKYVEPMFCVAYLKESGPAVAGASAGGGGHASAPVGLEGISDDHVKAPPRTASPTGPDEGGI